ncbi:hypothetical protein [Rheinheimera soli]|uniref:Lipoprotein n=1 Tax=Rheinheimera soli TaxID=443616 RepID=A0ABU1VTV0_9GAMM|nr:hypothetical protein [Rheinheimera soli]MDR7119147.1 hypothetical protein [Rheinheimera soli]
MHFYSPQLWILLAASLLAGCSTLPSSVPPEPTQTVHTTDQITECVGSIQAPAVGLEAISDPELLQSALGQPDKGQLCMGQVFVATAPVTVYRVWDQAKSYTLYGRWWSFSLPQGPTDQYREANAICPSWSVLNQMSSCTLKVGSKIVVGPGQSADCGDGLVYPQSAVNQVYINNDSRNNVLWVENCDAGSNWPH